MTRRLTREVDLDTGVVTLEAFRLNGKLHRNHHEGPAYICRSAENGRLVYERYYWHGRLHREGGPAKIEYDLTGKIALEEMYYLHGFPHRDPMQGPAYIERNDHGVARVETYLVNGAKYRNPNHGPCSISRYEDGQIEHEEYSDREDAVPIRRARKRSGPGPTP